MNNGYITGRLLGVIVFLIGIVMLGSVFITARNLFNSDKLGLSASSSSQVAVNSANAAQPAQNQAVNELSKAAIKLVFRLALLLLMTIISSAIASRGINLYFASTEQIKPKLPAE